MLIRFREVNSMIRKKKKYSRPRQIYEKERIEEENKLAKKYALKNKREIWKTLAKVKYYRGRAKELAKSSLEEQEVLYNKLRALGLKIDGAADVLGLKVENILERRLPTIMTNRKLANTTKQARQMVVHKRVLIDGKVMSAPSYLVPVAQEKLIAIKNKEKKAKSEESSAKKGEENKEESG